MNLSILGVGSLAAVLLSGGSYLLYDSFVQDGSQTSVSDWKPNENFEFFWKVLKKVYDDVRDPVDIYERCLNRVSSHIFEKDLWISKEDFVSSNAENLSREEKYWKDNGTFNGTTEQFNESMWWIELNSRASSVFGDWKVPENFSKYLNQVSDNCSFQLNSYFSDRYSELKAKYPEDDSGYYFGDVSFAFSQILGYPNSPRIDSSSFPDLKIFIKEKDIVVEKVEK